MLEDRRSFAQQEEVRRFTRVDVFWKAIVFSEGDPYEGMICNVSAGGVLVMLQEVYALETEVILRTKRLGDLPCQVSWRSSESVGLRFHVEPEKIFEMLPDILPPLPPPIVES